MRRMLLGLWIVLLSSVAYGEKGFHQYTYEGHDKNPLIPGSSFRVHQNDRPQPPRVIPGTFDEPGVAAAPSDAVILFDGSSLNHFQKTEWPLADGRIVADKGPLFTKQSYGDCQFHVEWRTPNPPQGKPGNMGNSGIFFMQKYELQIYDSYSSRIYADGSAAAIYGQSPPLVNVCRAPGEWQTYDVYFTAPVFEGESLVKPAMITVLHNGVFVHVDTEITGPTTHNKVTPYAPHRPRLPILFQGHDSPVEFRNIWIRDLEKTDLAGKNTTG